MRKLLFQIFLLFPFVYLFCSIFSHAKVHDSFYLKWKMKLINYSSEIRKAFFTVFLAIVINCKSNILNSPHTQYIGVKQNSRDDLERQT